jgi:hypothetical protein
MVLFAGAPVTVTPVEPVAVIVVRSKVTTGVVVQFGVTVDVAEGETDGPAVAGVVGEAVADGDVLGDVDGDGAVAWNVCVALAEQRPAVVAPAGLPAGSAHCVPAVAIVAVMICVPDSPVTELVLTLADPVVSVTTVMTEEPSEKRPGPSSRKVTETPETGRSVAVVTRAV